MDSRRSKKSRSIPIEPKSARPAPASARLPVVDRTRADPAVARRRASQSQPHVQVQTQKEDARGSDMRILDGVDRDSQVSARDDPFCRTYQSPHSARLAAELRISHGASKRKDDPSENANLPQVSIVVLGSPRVGKSTFIERALDLPESISTARSSKKMSLDGVIYVVRLFEVLIEDVAINGSGIVRWPRFVDDEKLPPVDGVLMLYDATDEASVNEIPDILYALNKSGCPSVLVSCKEDNPYQLRQVDLDFSQQIRSRFKKIETCSTSANVPESQKRCISIILRSILICRKGSVVTSFLSSGQSRESNSSGKATTQDAGQPPHKVKTHYRASCDLSVSEPEGAVKSLVVDFLSSRGLKPAPNPDTGLPLDDSLLQHPDSSNRSDLPRATSILRAATVDPTDSQADNTFLIMEEESQDEAMHEDDQPSSPNIGRSKPCELARDDTGKSFDELIDRLLAPPISKQDGKFVPVFLCLYRRFSSPSQVFSAVTSRFAQIERSNDAQLTKVGEQLRHLQVLALWSGDYPGDFAQHGIRKDVVAFVYKLEKSRVFAYAAKEISSHLELATEDEDAEWGRFDGLDAPDEAEESLHSQSEATSPSVRTGKSSTEELLKSSKQSSSEGSFEDLAPRSGAPSVRSSVMRSSNVSSKSLSLLPARSAIRQEADRLASAPRTRLSKIQWHQFVEIPDEEIAKELTRMDWILYSSIRPRDLVRHVILTHDADKAAKSLANVHRMVDHFNHLFCFVSGMILLRDKPKHRAQMLEKWMSVAWKVRQLNNYNTLGSIIAGINGTAVHRLTLTWELVPEQIRKEYMRLTILMGTVRSHSAYRMAWENSFFERIPFLPVYRKDLFAAETGNRTFVGSRGERINWRKFEIMGEVIISMQRSQDKPYKLPKSEQIMKLVLETKISQSDEDLTEELYERSLQVEPTGNGDSSRKKFDWFRR